LGPVFKDDLERDPAYRRWKKNEAKKPKGKGRDAAFYILTETDIKDKMKTQYPNGNMILREDYQKSFKAETRFADTKTFLRQ